MEFQSTVDLWMALRFANYITNFYMALVKARREENRRKRQAGELTEPIAKLPAVFLLLLYNSDEPWTAPAALSESNKVLNKVLNKKGKRLPVRCTPKVLPLR